MTTKVKTKKRCELESRWNSIYVDYCRLAKVGSMKMPTYERLAQKYGMHRNSIARIVKNIQKKEAKQ